jgi:plastocyanin
MSAMPHRDLRPGRRRALALVLAAVVVLAAAAGCGGGDDAGEVREIVVPLGTQERLDRGEDVVVMPSELRFQVGDTLRIRNDDVAHQTVGPYEVPAGEQFELRYGKPGRYEGVCPLSEGDAYTIVVTG